MKKDTLSSIAAKAGCSVATVSRVLNGVAEKNRITRDTVEKVLAVARESGYVSRSFNQIPDKSRKNAIGLLVPSVANPFFAEMANIIASDAYSLGYAVFILDADEDADRFVDWMQMLDSSGVSGIIAVPCGDCEGLLEKIDSHTPIVLLDRYFKDSPLPYVSCNNYQGGLDAAKALIDAGCKRIVAIQGPESSVPSTERVRGFFDAVNAAGLGENCKVVGNEFSSHCGYIESKLFLSDEERPDGIFALGNTIMLGAVRAIRESGLSIPDDISIICFDDSPFMDLMSPPITRIGQPMKDMASLAFKLLLDRIASQSQSTSHILLAPDFLRGESIRKKDI